MIVTHRERERERERQTQAEGEAGSMHREPDVGFDPGSPGSRPGPKAGAKPLLHPGIPLLININPICNWKMAEGWEWGKLTRQETTYVGEDVERGEPSCTVGGNVNWCSHSENCVEVPQRVKNRATLDPTIALLGIYPKDTDAVKWQDTCTPMFIAAMFTIAKLWKEPRCPSKDEWIKR